MTASLSSAPSGGGRVLAGAWFILGLVSLGLSALLAVVLVAGRTPFIALGDSFFRVALVLHVDFAVLVWFLSAAGGIWTLIHGRSTAAGWLAFGLAATGVFGLLVSPLFGGIAPILSNYVPVLDNPIFLGALASFSLGVVLTAAWSLLGAPAQGTLPRQLIHGARWAAFIALVAAAVFSVDYLNARARIDSLTADDIAWGAGHLLQFLHGVLMLSIWSVLGHRALAQTPRFNRLIPLLLATNALPAIAGILIATIYAVGSGEHRAGFTELMRWTSWPAAVVLALCLLTGMIRMIRAGTVLILEERALLLSMTLFLAGCVIGATIHGNATMSVPAHYHGTVGAVTLAYIAFGWRLLAEYRPAVTVSLWGLRLPLLYGGGILTLVAGLAWAGQLGVPRKAPHAELMIEEGAYFMAMGLAGIGGFLALAAIAAFVGMVLFFVLRKRAKTPTPAQKYDIRGRALLVTLVAVLGGGLLLSSNGQWLPDNHWLNKLDATDKHRAEIDLRFQQGVVMLHANEFEHALTAFHRVIELDPKMPEAHVNIGFALLGLEKYSAAADFFDEASNLRPDQINAYYGLAVALEGLGNLRGATEAMNTYLHRAAANDPFRKKAEAALWEWQQAAAQQSATVRPMERAKAIRPPNTATP